MINVFLDLPDDKETKKYFLCLSMFFDELRKIPNGAVQNLLKKYDYGPVNQPKSHIPKRVKIDFPDNFKIPLELR